MALKGSYTGQYAFLLSRGIPNNKSSSMPLKSWLKNLLFQNFDIFNLQIYLKSYWNLTSFCFQTLPREQILYRAYQKEWSVTTAAERLSNGWSRIWHPGWVNTYRHTTYYSPRFSEEKLNRRGTRGDIENCLCTCIHVERAMERINIFDCISDSQQPMFNELSFCSQDNNTSLVMYSISSLK